MKVPIKLRVQVVARAFRVVFRRPAYVMLATATALGMAGIMIWALNVDLLWYILTDAPLTLFGRIEFFAYGYQSLFTTYDDLLSLGMVCVSVLFGINTALLVYVLRRRGKDGVPLKSGGGAFVFALLGSGCVACGTSLFAPLLATLGAGSALVLRDIGTILNWVGCLLLAYSITIVSGMVRYQVKNHAASRGVTK